jgi:hypothetical protein
MIRLAKDLEVRGMVVRSMSPEGTQDTADQEEMLRQAIRAAEAVLIVASPHARSSWTIKEQLRIARMYQRRVVVIWADGSDMTEVLPAVEGKPPVIDARENSYSHALDELEACLDRELAGSRPGVSSLPTATSQPPEPRNPYKGLRAFTQDDADDFFGRDTLIEELLQRLAPRQTAMLDARLLTVIGPSGSGKSSVVMAGLLPGLRKGELPGSEEWVYLSPMVPGMHPLEALALALEPHFPDKSMEQLHHTLQSDSMRGLHLLATELVEKPGQKVVLVIDQFEEIFNRVSSEQERRRFIDLLMAAVTEPRGPLIVILTLRADLYDRPLAYPELGRLIQHDQVAVLPMEMQDLRAVITRPATLPDVRLAFEGSLVGDLLFEVEGQRGALPLLQFTLDQLFQRRKGHLLTLTECAK